MTANQSINRLEKAIAKVPFWKEGDGLERWNELAKAKNTLYNELIALQGLYLSIEGK